MDPFLIVEREVEKDIRMLTQNLGELKGVDVRKAGTVLMDIDALFMTLEKLHKTVVAVENEPYRFSEISTKELERRRSFVDQSFRAVRSLRAAARNAIKKEKLVGKRISKRKQKALVKKHKKDDDDVSSGLELLEQQQEETLEEIEHQVSALGNAAESINEQAEDHLTLLKTLDTATDAAKDAMERTTHAVENLLQTRDRCKMGVICVQIIIISVLVVLLLL